MEILGLPDPDPRERRKRDASVLGGSIGRRRPRPDRRALIGSIAFHSALVLGLFATTVVRREQPEFEVYRVKLFSPPPQQEAPTPEPVALNTRIQAPRPSEVPPVQPRTEPPRPTPRPQTVEQPAEKPPPRPAEPTKGPQARPDSPGGENIDVNFEGREFPYPEYLENIILQLNRHFRWSGSPNLQSQVMFYVNRDGSVGGIRVLEKSGDFNFDLQSMSAIEQAGRRGAFGPLPDGWAQDRLWVRFRFLPPG
jgi:hypothetical protein